MTFVKRIVYVLHMTPLKNRRAFLRAVQGIPLDRQRVMATGYRCAVIYDGGTRRERDLFVSSLRAGDHAYVPRLDCLLLPKSERGKVRPTADLTGAITALLLSPALIVEGASDVTSADREAFANQVQSAVQRVSSGYRSPAALRKIGKKGAALKALGSPVIKWRGEAMADEHERQRQIWTSALYMSDDAAREHLCDELRGLSNSTVRRIFGARRPNDKSAGGRPPKSKATR